MSDRRRKLPLARLAWRNTCRHRRRTLLTVTAIAVAVAALTYTLSHVDGLLTNMLNTYARTESGHIRIRKVGYASREKFLPVHLFVPKIDSLLTLVRGHPDVEEALPRVRAAVLVDGADSNRPGLLLGMDLAREEGYFGPERMITVGRMPQAGQPEVAVGRKFAANLDLGVGDTITLLGQTAYRSLGGIRLSITGLLASGLGQLDNLLLVVPLDQAQILTDLDNATTEILAFAKNPGVVDSLVIDLQHHLGRVVWGELEVRSWKQQGPLVQIIETGKAAFGIMLGLMFLMAALIIVNTMLMSVLERTSEFGMQAALGMRRRDIVRMIITEGLTIGILGALCGCLLGSAVAIWLESNGIDLGSAAEQLDLPIPMIVYPDWQFLYPVIGFIVGIVVASLAAIYPAWRAVRFTPAEALRT